MYNFPPLLTAISDTAEWAELSGAMSSGRGPHALAAILPPDLADGFRDAYARMALCFSGTGTDGCPSCECWTEGGHPDVIVAGDGTGPPGVADCIALQSSMNLRPFAARGRLGVVPFADMLSLPAANSLLKTAEEPPEGGRLLLLAEEDNLIPTIRSRVWTVRFSEALRVEALPPPQSASDWARWLERTRKNSLDEIASEADSWSRWFCDMGEWVLAASLRNTIYLSRKRHMPVSMVQDSLFAILREGVRSEQIFSDLREA
jgi:DNA polymerase-3 subunit delta'